MKYFTYNLWININNDDENIRDSALKEYEINELLYKEVYNRIKSELPQNYIKIYEANSGFHDWKIETINIFTSSRNNCSKVQIHISNLDKTYIITYSYVSKVSILYNKEDLMSHPTYGTWGYDELLKIEPEIYSNEILMPNGSLIEIYFKKISIKRVTE